MFNPLQLAQNLKLILPILFVISIFYYIVSLKTELNRQVEQNIILKQQLDLQNKTIEKMKLDTENFKLKLPSVDKKIKNKYNIINNDNTCDAKLQTIRGLLDKFYVTDNKQYTK